MSMALARYLPPALRTIFIKVDTIGAIYSSRGIPARPFHQITVSFASVFCYVGRNKIDE